MKINLALVLAFVSLSACLRSQENIDYLTFLQEISVKRNEFNQLYHNADKAQKDSLIIESRAYLFNTITNSVFPYWYNTKWDFNGTTRTPKEGQIACGYFVTNVLTDVGFNIPRIKWAQSASEVFIIKLCPNQIKRFSNRPISEVENYLELTGDGLYMVGLDSHVGFIVVKNNTIKFVHSNYYQPWIGVMSEEIDSTNPLRDSDYRVIGKLLSDGMMVNWINFIAYD